MAISLESSRRTRTAPILLRLAVVALTLATASIHAQLGGLLFTLNALGYLTLALAMVAPGPVGHIRWLVRLALLAFTAVTIVGWLVMGARFPLAYLDKGIEALLIVFLGLELWLDGGPGEIVRRRRRAASHLRRTPAGTTRARPV